jgi:hypothetical protein
VAKLAACAGQRSSWKPDRTAAMLGTKTDPRVIVEKRSMASLTWIGAAQLWQPNRVENEGQEATHSSGRVGAATSVDSAPR